MALAKQEDLGNEQWLRKIRLFSLGKGRHCSDLIDAFSHMQNTDKIDLDKLFSLAKTQKQDDIMHILGNWEQIGTWHETTVFHPKGNTHIEQIIRKMH